MSRDTFLVCDACTKHTKTAIRVELKTTRILMTNGDCSEHPAPSTTIEVCSAGCAQAAIEKFILTNLIPLPNQREESQE